MNQPPFRSSSMVSAISLLVLSLALPGAARAQYFTSTGANNSSPTNFFPIDPAAPVLDFTGNTLFIGNSAPGSFSALAGALLRADGFSLGAGATGSGVASVSGTGTQVLLGGAPNRLQVGLWGTGSLSVSAGALVDAAINPSACLAVGAFCNSFIGNAAGSTATLNITGAGSEVRTLRNLGIGQTSVFTTAVDDFSFGTPGGTTNASVNVLAGGTFRTQNVSAGVGPNRPAALGTEKGFATLLVDGAGSKWIAGRNSIDNTAAGFTLGVGAGGTGSLSIQNGGSMLIDGTGGATTGFDFMNIGVNNGKGSVLVSGIGSSLQVAGNNPVLQVGRSGASAEGSLGVLAGATVSSMFLNVGRDLALGTLVVDGAGSLVTLSGVGTPGTAGPAGAQFGQGGGTGLATISNGARLLVSDGGADGRPNAAGSPYINVGRDAGSFGRLTISGPGSRVEMVSTSLALAPGLPDNFNPYMAVGRFAGGTGELFVTDGGKLLLQGNAVSTVAETRVTQLNIGGGGNTEAGGVGRATVSGLGSEIRLAGGDAMMFVGRGPGANGTLSVADRASISALGIINGRGIGATGTIALNNGALNLSGQQTGDVLAGAFFTIGTESGTGSVSLAAGSRVDLTNLGSSGASLTLGGTQLHPLGNGSLTASGASNITITAASGLASFTVGRDGVGTAGFSGASSIAIGDGAAHIGRFAGGSGTLTLASGSSLAAGTVGIGGSSDTLAGGTGSVTVTGLGSLMSASGDSAFIGVGRGGTGTLAVTDRASVAATVMNIGRAAGGVGTLTVDNGSLALSGQQASGNGAALSIGNRGGTGTASIVNGSVLNITNFGSDGASLNVGGTPVNPLGTGTLTVAGGSQINVLAAPGQAQVRVGHDGSATATLTGSFLNVGSSASTYDGVVTVAGTPGSSATLTLNAGSVLNAGYVGVGANPGGPGGNGQLILNDSTINTTTFEIGALGLLTGNNGVINAKGDVIVAGTISPGNSPGRIIINCNIITLPGSRIILDVLDTGDGFNVDHLTLGNDATFDLSKIQVVFNFLGDTNPAAFAASGGFDLDNFLQSQDLATGVITGLSTVFAAGETWGSIFSADQFSVVVGGTAFTGVSFAPDGGVTFTPTAVPEPGTWALLIAGLAVVVTQARRRGGRGAAAR